MIMIGPDAHGPEPVEAVLEPALDDVLEMDDAQDPRPSSATTSGVPPDREIRSTASLDLRRELAARRMPGWRRGRPCGCCRPSMSTPLIRVCAEKEMNLAPGMSARERPRKPYFLARTTMLRPSGVSSAREASWAASASSSTVTPGAGRNAAAWRSPRVMVPVLSSRSTSTSPAASTARPLMARTFFWTRRSMPAMPMALSRPPMVVGIRQTSRATRTVIVKDDAGVEAEGLQGDDRRPGR